MLNSAFKGLWLMLFGHRHIDNAALEEGRQDYLADRHQNPHPPLSYAHYSWKRGHNSAMANDPDNAW